jgi:hypothetical protein
MPELLNHPFITMVVSISLPLPKAVVVTNVSPSPSTDFSLVYHYAKDRMKSAVLTIIEMLGVKLEIVILGITISWITAIIIYV